MSKLHSQSSQLSCPICYQSFSTTNPSTVICSNKHSICGRCVGSLSSFRCPFCRITINFGQAAANQSNQAGANRPSSNQRHQSERYNQNLRWAHIKDNFLLVCSDNSWVFLVGIHSALLFFEIVIAVSDNQPNCVDNPYSLLLTLRQFSFFKEIWGLFNTTYFFVLMLMLHCLFGNGFRFDKLVVCFLIQFSLKILFWAIIQPILFFAIVKDHCSGGIYAYGLIQVILHTFIIPIFVIFHKKLIR